MSQNSSAGATDPPPQRPSKRERLVTSAAEVTYTKGVAATTLADIAAHADVPLGNVYYYFKTKDSIVSAVVDAHADQLASALADLEQRHRTPRTRLTALVKLLAARGDSIATYGCLYGTLTSELAKGVPGSDADVARLLRIPLNWAEQQFQTMGCRDASALALELVAAYQGAAVISNAFGDSGALSGTARRLIRWIEALAP